ncbi:invasion associated locus B family protein [Pseudooceanicola algae]|uniref:Uncharacterized protein n=1 Tax=Pseudooceanicola algae TaxID=1537215 RepID=A0A418SEF4_9RHOB|nr:invasion associated locus B family protein [Pseudooceanicola algae]QPM89743.1 hypothetical protein PSAL_009690 [Pseudooceanicola algae]
MFAISKVTTALALTGLLALPAYAQDAETPATDAPTPEAGSTDLGGLSMGEDPMTETQTGAVYIRENAGDWAVQCIKTENGEDEPCQLYQLLRDEQNNPVAEIIVYKVEDDSQAVAGANIVAPLETLLPAGLVVSVDQGAPKKYPFAVCNRVGCVSRIGLTEADLNTFKNGGSAEVIIRPYSAPQVEVKLPLSLTGFTNGFEKTTVIPTKAPN